MKDNDSLILYSAIIGNYEEPKVPQVTLSENVSYISLSNVYSSDLPHDAFPRAKARYVKVKGYQDFKQRVAMWVDGSFIINCDPLKFLSDIEFDDCDIAVLKHRDRNNSLDEANVILEKDLDPVVRQGIEEQISFYKKEGYGFDNGLAETGILIRKNSKKVDTFSDLWWEQISHFSLRDQISFNYCLWVMERRGEPLKVKYIEPDAWRGNAERSNDSLPEDFHWLEYERLNADVKRSKLTKKELEYHWLKWGAAEGREYSVEDSKNRSFIYIPH